MIKVKDAYILIDDIKAMYYRYDEDCTGYLVIKYRFEEEETKIPVIDFQEYEILAKELSERINILKGLPLI